MGASIIVILFAILTLVDIAAELFVVDGNFAGIDGMMQNVELITGSFVMLLSFIFLLPEFYVGFKGIKVARDPDSSKAHIFFAILIFIIAILNVISAIVAIISQVDIAGNGVYGIDNVFRAIVYFVYIKCAMDVRS